MFVTTNPACCSGPTALPVRKASGDYLARHGRGYSRFEHTRADIALDLLQFVPGDEPVKVSRLRIRNLSGRTRHLTLTAYVEWVLGTSRSSTAPFVATEIDPVTGGMLARNLWGGAETRVAFTDLGGLQTAWTGNRMEFIGRNGTLERPAALATGARLSGRTGAGLDPCGALQTSVVLAAHASVELVWLLGEAGTTQAAQAMIARWRSEDVDAALQSVRADWSAVLDTVTVRTPDRAFDLMLNGWLLYQVLACRVWARSAFYQSSGAYGFRDQLQDTMALILAKPALAREHLLRAAGRQFVEGDVQHWWLPQTGRGVRTRVSDDRVWLGYCVAHYVETTADAGVLDEVVPFLDGPALQPGETDNFFLPSRRRAVGDAFRTLRARTRRQPCRRFARPAADRHRRLERRDERRRRRGTRRKRLAGLVPALRVVGIRAAGRGTGRARAGRDLACARCRLACVARGTRLGRRLVSTRVLRRRHADGIGGERRVPHRLDRAVVERAVRRRGPRPGGACDGIAGPAPASAATTVWPCC